MPSAVRLTAAGLVAGATMLAAAGCGGVDSASAASITHDDLVSELAAQLSGVSTLSYTATYQLAGGAQAQITQAQAPTRVAYSYPGGRMIRTATAVIRCRGTDRALTCAESSPDPVGDSSATPLTAPAQSGAVSSSGRAGAASSAGRAGAASSSGRAGAAGSAGPLTTPETVLAMLNAAAVDTGVVAAQHDTTIAGRHATCLALTGVTRTVTPNFGVCVTADGALGSFTATINGTPADMALIAYSDKPDLSAFDLPSTARLNDQRH